MNQPRILIGRGARALGGAAGRIHIAATHGLFLGGALERFAAFPVERLVVSDSVEKGDCKSSIIPLEVVSLEEILSNRIRTVSGNTA